MLESMSRRGREQTVAGKISLALILGCLALVVLGATVPSRELITDTLNVLLKDKDDIARALREAVR